MNQIRYGETWINTNDFQGPTGNEYLNLLKESGFIPYAGDDSTCGIENEFQTAVSGKNSNVDLPAYIRESNYLRNLIKRINRGDLSGKALSGLMEYLDANDKQIWENSWVRFPRNTLSCFAESVFRHDIKQDKSMPAGPDRRDSDTFIIRQDGREFLRIPVSYMLKLALADSLDGRTYIHPAVRNTGIRFLDSFLNDNTSPEITSFFPVKGGEGTRSSENIRNQTLKTYLLIQLLVLYANKKFELSMHGQDVSVYFSPHPPVRQKILNDLIPDSFYRELYMSPCLSGWDRGEEKHSYMHLCHQVLSRSSLHSILKLKEAGIIPGNRVYLKGISNISLANNGTHVSIGSRKLSSMLKQGSASFTSLHEKYYGDLAIKIFEHFIPLFTGIYSASPYRLSFHDFHPEKVLGFLSHELDFTQLRMIWRMWQGKADLRIFGNPVLPSGPEWFESYMLKTFRLRGDYVSDFRLIDFPVSFLSTDESPLFNGMPGSDEKLKKDLASMGIFDSKMSVYTIYRMRKFTASGFTGFEGRYYSLFESLENDLGNAVGIQTLITAMAWKYIINNEITHEHIPDTPETESERRQIIFASSIGLPFFYIRKNTPCSFMRKILSATGNIKASNRYPGFLKIRTSEYLKALVKIIRSDARDLIESMDIEKAVADLELRVAYPAEYSASNRLTSGILKKAGAKTPLGISADEFNLCAEEYYRENLREKHMNEAFTLLMDDINSLDRSWASIDPKIKEALNTIMIPGNSPEFIRSMKSQIIKGDLPLLYIITMIQLILILLYKDMKNFSAVEDKNS